MSSSLSLGPNGKLGVVGFFPDGISYTLLYIISCIIHDDDDNNHNNNNNSGRAIYDANGNAMVRGGSAAAVYTLQLCSRDIL